ncbi:MAG: cyclic nucleotide-binding domain-containing protein [Ignavibacteria bacterium]|nr:cyclic nucleotide-binding domain-containing protein [Ignavibacteria bacterium]
MAIPKFVGESSIWRNIFSERRVRRGSTEELLSQVPAFSGLNTRELKEVAAIVHKREYRAGETVFAQGDPGLGMYVVQEGEVAIVLEDKWERKRELVVLTDGDFFGELGLIDESPRSANAVCRTPCALIGFFRPDLMELIERDHKLGIKIVHKLAEIVATRLRNTDNELTNTKHELETLQHQIERNSHGEKSDTEDSRREAKENPDATETD